MDLILVRRLSSLSAPITRHSSNISDPTRVSMLSRTLASASIKTPCQNVIQIHRCFIRALSSHKTGPLWQETRHRLDQRHQQQLVKATSWDPSVGLPPYVDEHLSYAYGRSSKELKYHTVAPMIDAMAKREPHSTAVVVYDEGISKNFEELRSDVYKLINGMVKNLGVKRGDKIGIYSYNNYQFLLVQLACMALGCVLNPFNPSYKAHEFSYVLGKSDIKVLFTTGKNSRQSTLNDHHTVVCDNSVNKLQVDGLLEHLSHIVLLDGEMSAKDLTLEGVTICRWRHVFADCNQIDANLQKMFEEVRADDLYGVYYTSGTTGFPKGAAISQFNVINNAALAIERIFTQRGPLYKPLRPNVCLPLPLFHEFAGVLGIMLPFINGGSFVLTGLRYNIQSVVESIMRFKCNAIFLTPTILIDLITYVERNKLTNVPLKTMLVAGSKVLSELVHKTHKTLPNLEELRIGYGSSENGVIATIQTSQESPETRPFTVGPPLDFTEIRVVDANTGETTLLGQSGEVQTRGFNTMVGYYKDPERTDEVITKSRWYKTGDLGIIDEKGSLQIVGRIKELIIKGGENVYPAEIETVLHTHPLIEDAHVFGVPDKRFGEEICVWIKLDKSKCFKAPAGAAAASEDELKKEILDYCKQKLTYFKVPKYVMFVEEFPLTPVKKIKKFEMRAQATKMLNL